MIEDGIKCCPFCGSKKVRFSPTIKRFVCEDCKKTFDKPALSESVKENAIDTRKITAFLASPIKLTAERDLISSVAAESNGADHRTYIELNRCEYDTAIKMTSTQQEMYDSWIRDSDVFILVVSKSGIGEWTEKEIAIAAERKKTQNIKTLAFVQNGSEDGNLTEAEKYYRMAADQGEVHAQLSLGRLFQKAKNLSEAIKYYYMAADLDDLDAKYELGALLYETEYNTSEAEDLIFTAADEGHRGAQYLWGSILRSCGDSLGAEKYYRMAADQGDHDTANIFMNLLRKERRDAGEYPDEQLDREVYYEDDDPLPIAPPLETFDKEEGMDFSGFIVKQKNPSEQNDPETPREDLNDIAKRGNHDDLPFLTDL